MFIDRHLFPTSILSLVYDDTKFFNFVDKFGLQIDRKAHTYRWGYCANGTIVYMDHQGTGKGKIMRGKKLKRKNYA